MGKKLDALLRRGFKTSKFKATVALAISRLAVLKNQRQARCSVARSDVVELLKNSNNHERALLRVEQVIKEQNMLDVFVSLEAYCHLLQERVNLLEQEKVCPEELQEAVSTLIFAASRCGEFPELQEIRAIFTSRFGREFAARAVELRNNCGVNPKVIQKLSTRMPSLAIKMKMLKEIATDNNIDLPIEDTIMETKDSIHEEKPMPQRVSNQEENIQSIHPQEIDRSVRRKYKDVADAAQVAFESAAYAAQAARAAVELSRSGPTDPYTPREGKKFQTRDENSSEADDEQRKTDQMKFEKIHPVQNFETEDSDLDDDEERYEDVVTVFKRSGSGLSSDSFDADKVKQREVIFDESSDGEEGNKRGQIGNFTSQYDEEKRNQSTEPLNINRRPISVRTRRTFGR